MKNQSSASKVICLVIATSFLFASCENQQSPNSNQVTIGELRDDIPCLTYKNLPKLKKALQLAFSAGARIDTVFLHSGKETQNEGVIMLTAIAKESDSIFTSVNFQIRRPNGKPITWVPIDEARWCTGQCVSGNSPVGCYSNKTTCLCGGTGNCSTMPIVVGGVNRPKDLAEILIPYLAQR